MSKIGTLLAQFIQHDGYEAGVAQSPSGSRKIILTSAEDQNCAFSGFFRTFPEVDIAILGTNHSERFQPTTFKRAVAHNVYRYQD